MIDSRRSHANLDLDLVLKPAASGWDFPLTCLLIFVPDSAENGADQTQRADVAKRCSQAPAEPMHAATVLPAQFTGEYISCNNLSDLYAFQPGAKFLNRLYS